MNQEPETSPSWRNIAVLALGVAVVVVVALLLSQLDALQRRSQLPSNGVPVNDVEATLAAGELATIYLPGEATPLSTPLMTPTRSAQPSATATRQTPTVEASANCGEAAGGAAVHIVKSGDTWSSLAAQFGLPEELLREANCPTSKQLLEGQQIYIPQILGAHSFSRECEAPAGWKPYKLEPGVTLTQLSRSHGVSIKQILKANCLRDPYVGGVEEIFLP
jgi:LysM repeat protein